MISQGERDGKGACAPFHLVLAETEDLTALRTCSALRRVARAEFVTPDELFMAAHWSHDPLGSSRVELASGLVLDGSTVLSIFNRVTRIAPLQFSGSRAADQRYASEELFALLVSWLTGFGGACVNPPHPGSIPGYAARSVAEDRLRLGAELHASSRARNLGPGADVAGFPDAGVPVEPGGPGQRLADHALRRVLIIGDTFSQDLPAGLRGRLLGEMSARGLVLADVVLEEGEAGCQPVSLNPLPETGNEAEIRRIADYLLSRARAERGAT